MSKKIILTGDRPTGRLHIGHFVGSLRRRVELQESGLFDKIFIMIADAQALTDNADNPERETKRGRCLGMVWYWFTARKNGKHIRERIPSDSQTDAVSELEKMGYTDIVITDIVIAE